MALDKLKFRLVHTAQRTVINPLVRKSGGVPMIETIGRKSGLPRQTPIGGKRRGGSFWMVSEHGYQSDYVRNIEANPAVRVRIRGVWHAGTAVLLPDDDTDARLADLGGINSVGVRLAGTERLTIRIDFD
ncbi:nitroreductase/quinone reductase family protein [Smaragdicoccus niigatensis]|uniref:nitroreductase/quinone reductase family protein n=1 Tax=Smaragdicoccus niigatensis TaxID=359359 RepID=UPI00036B0A47|nr:nitroreductase/quinone reductase family protein [Smaragdicoccus niigatensis]